MGCVSWRGGTYWLKLYDPARPISRTIVGFSQLSRALNRRRVADTHILDLNSGRMDA